ncbi:MAG: type III pantothenate kinase [bacterium]|nr:type III pantothenate kinase [bacterium]
MRSGRGEADLFLAIDCGNTTTHFGVCSRDRILADFRIPSDERALLREAPGAIAARIRGEGAPGGAIISSVVPRLHRALGRLCGRVGARPLWLTHRTPTGIHLLYRRPAEIGADRIANAVAAHARYGGGVIVVDIGTAITFDCISRSGAYLGGVIAPGPAMARGALAAGTGLLPLVGPGMPAGVIGKSTAHAVRAGTVFGTRALIAGIVDGIRREMGGRPKIVFTGGQLVHIVQGWRYPKIVEPLLTLDGLRIIYGRVRPRRAG